MKFIANKTAIEILNLNNAIALRFEPQERKRQNATNLKVRSLTSRVKATNQAEIKRRAVSENYTEVSFNISRDALNEFGITSIKAGKYVLKEFGAGYFEFLPANVLELKPNDAVITVR